MKKSPPDPALQAMLQRFAAGTVPTEREFDLIFPREARKFGRALWTSVEVAHRAALWLGGAPSRRILDVGSGVGKFCFVAELSSPGRYEGIDSDAERVAIAQAVGRQYSLRSRFSVGDGLAVDWNAYDGLYLYNPFEDYAACEQAALKLARLPPGARVAIYNGIGAPLPQDLRIDHVERIGACDLQLGER